MCAQGFVLYDLVEAVDREGKATDLSQMTHYVLGRSGSDGVHYNTEEAKEWANRVARELDNMLR